MRAAWVACGLAFTAVAASVVAAQPDAAKPAPADAKPAPADAKPAPADAKPAAAKPAAAKPAADAAAPSSSKFDHAAHAKLAKPVAIAKCETCHPTDAKGTLTAPGKTGHQPCLDSGCHVDDFLSVGDDTKQSDPKRYAKAAEFCQGCHKGKAGEAPKRWQKARPDNVFVGNPNPNYHVEFKHYDHTQKTGCRDCHVVDPTTFELRLDTPGHAQCATCHGRTGPPMAECGNCHAQPGPTAYFTKPRPNSDVRTCDSAAYAKLAEESSDKVPCFKHETTQHRFAKSGEKIECGTCHFMIDDKSAWGSYKYLSVRDLKESPVIHNNRDLAHKNCGNSAACHANDVDESHGTGRCKLCHSKRVVESLFE